MKLNIGLDMDGVIVDWEGTVCRSLNLNIDDKNYQRLISGELLSDLYPIVDDFFKNTTVDFWSKLDSLPWYNDLYSVLNKYGNTFILSSSGSPKRGADFISTVTYGKYLWLEKNLPGVDAIITYYKHYCANSNTILIDDSKKKVDKFRECGGIGLLWPNQHKLLSKNVNVNKILGELEEILIDIKDNPNNLEEVLDEKKKKNYMLLY